MMAETITTPELKRTTMYFPRAVHSALRLEAAQTGRSMTEIVLEALAARTSSDPTPPTAGADAPSTPGEAPYAPAE